MYIYIYVYIILARFKILVGARRLSKMSRIYGTVRLVRLVGTVGWSGWSSTPYQAYQLHSYKRTNRTKRTVPSAPTVPSGPYQAHHLCQAYRTWFLGRYEAPILELDSIHICIIYIYYIYTHYIRKYIGATGVPSRFERFTLSKEETQNSKIGPSVLFWTIFSRGQIGRCSIWFGNEFLYDRLLGI